MRNRGYDVQTIRTDQGTEYSSSEIESYLRLKGIENVITGRAAREQMHVAESMNLTLTEMARTMIIDEGLAKAWWGHEVKNATMIRNSCTTSTFKSKERIYHWFFHKNADLKIFKPFGCTALVYITI